MYALYYHDMSDEGLPDAQLIQELIFRHDVALLAGVRLDVCIL
jgi:hypothetical protein